MEGEYQCHLKLSMTTKKSADSQKPLQTPDRFGPECGLIY